MKSDVSVIILAAGKGTRMKSNLLKVLNCVGGKTLLEHVVTAAQQLKPKNIVVVAPTEKSPIEENIKTFSNNTNIQIAIQAEQRGTGHAVMCALKDSKIKSGTVVVLYGDMPFLSGKSLKQIVALRTKKKATLALASAHKENPFGFGRIVRDEKHNVDRIIEEKDTSAAQKKITEVNVGIYAFDGAFLTTHVTKLKTANKQKEYYITDLIHMAVAKKKIVAAHVLSDISEVAGVNSPAELCDANLAFYNRQRLAAFDDGVQFIGRGILIDADVKLSPGVIIEAPCHLKGKTVIETGVHIEMGCVIKSARIGANALIKAHSYIDHAEIAEGCQVGPFAHLRPGTKLMTGAKVGNFVEIKKTTIGTKSKVSHLSYIGDATIGSSVNIGAGTITCNYDGFNKFETHIEDNVFIGSDTQLVAPVHIDKGAFIGAGSTVTKNVEADSLVISRTAQRSIPDWAKKHREKNKK